MPIEAPVERSRLVGVVGAAGGVVELLGVAVGGDTKIVERARVGGIGKAEGSSVTPTLD